jgi:glutamyl-tRNA reductase
LIIGTGKTAELVVNYINKLNSNNIYITSHTKERAIEKAMLWNCTAVNINEIAHYLNKVDVVIGGTDCEVNFFGAEVVNDLCHKEMIRNFITKPLLFIDLGVPRNFNSDLKKIKHVSIFDLDDLKKTTNYSIDKREKALPEAYKIIEEELQGFNMWLNVFEVTPIIKNYIAEIETVKKEGLKWVLPKLGDLSEHQVAILERFVHKIIREVSQKPLKKIRKMAQTPNQEINELETFMDIFDINNQ